MQPEKIIGSNIRKIREQKGLKSELLARHLGISKGRISQIESGHCKELTIIRINKIAEFLDVNFFEVVSNKNKIGNNEFGADHPGHQHHASSESIKKIVDELVNRMMR